MRLRPLSSTVSSSSDDGNMLDKVCLSSGKWQKTVFVILLCLGIFGTPKISYSAGQKIQCVLSPSVSRVKSGTHILAGITLNNISSQMLVLPWPADVNRLLKSGALSVSIKSESGKKYAIIPDPGPAIARRRNHYQELEQNQSISKTLDLCWFRGGKDHHSLCGRPGKYTVSATYSNLSTDYLDHGSHKWVQLNEVWTGKATCNEITIEIVAEE